MIITDLPGLLGDAIGVIPAVIELSKKEKVYIPLNPKWATHCAKQIYDMIPSKYNVIFIDDECDVEDKILHFDLSKSFGFCINNNLHMIQGAFHILGLPVPKDIPKPEIEFVFKEDVLVYDYVLAPFSRSLPPEQKWQQDNWNKLVDRMFDKTFVVFGDDRYDKRDFVFEKPNVTHMYSHPLNEAISVMRKSRHGVLSVVTGISHFAYPLGIKNFLFNNQNMKWGTNPEAIILGKNIHNYTPEEVEKIIR